VLILSNGINGAAVGALLSYTCVAVVAATLRKGLLKERRLTCLPA